MIPRAKVVVLGKKFLKNVKKAKVEFEDAKARYDERLEVIEAELVSDLMQADIAMKNELINAKDNMMNIMNGLTFDEMSQN